MRTLQCGIKTSVVTERYVDFDQMEYMPEIASSNGHLCRWNDDLLRTAAHAQHQVPQRRNSKQCLRLCSTTYLNLPVQSISAGARTMCKYGDFFLYLDVDDKVWRAICRSRLPAARNRKTRRVKTPPTPTTFNISGTPLAWLSRTGKLPISAS